MQARSQRIPEGRLHNTSIARMEAAQRSVISGDGAAHLVSPVLRAAFPFNSLVAHWPSGFFDTPDAQLEVRAFTREGWSVWFALEPLRDFPATAEQTGRQYSEPLFFVQARKVQYRYHGTQTVEAVQAFRAIELIYFDTSTKRSSALSFVHKLFGVGPTLADGAVPVVSRTAWGADENYRLTSTGTVRWEPQYLPVQKFIVHHTAGSDGGSDPMGTIRGIYYYHAVVLGWGDLGYNYLIDPSGAIYEGRYGGDGVVGGHTYNSATNTNYNEGSAGIALLGNFEESVPTSAALESLSSLLAEKGQLFSVPPTGQGFFLSADMPNVVGHGDVDSTLCPGLNLRSQMETLRLAAQAKYDALRPLPAVTFGAELAGTANTEVTLRPGEKATVTAAYRNTGSAAWQPYVPGRGVHVVRVGDVSATSLVQTDQWASSSDVAATADANVPVQAIGNFSFTVQAPNNVLTASEAFALQTADGQELAGTRFSVIVQVTGLEYAAVLDASAVPKAVFVSGTQNVTVRVTNAGTKAWSSEDLRLAVYDLDEQPSKFRAPQWTSPTGDFPLDQQTVEPGATGSFTFAIRTPSAPGTYQHTLQLSQRSASPLIYEAQQLVTRVDSHWQAKLVSSSLPKAVGRTWRPVVTIKVQNTGIATWTRRVRLKVYDLAYTQSKFRHASWPSATADAVLQEAKVPSGSTGTFVVKLRPPSAPGTYRILFRMEVRKNPEIVQGGAFEGVMRVD